MDVSSARLMSNPWPTAWGYTGGSNPGQIFIGDFGGLGLWQYGDGFWRIESGADAEGIIAVGISSI